MKAVERFASGERGAAQAPPSPADSFSRLKLGGAIQAADLARPQGTAARKGPSSCSEEGLPPEPAPTPVPAPAPAPDGSPADIMEGNTADEGGTLMRLQRLISVLPPAAAAVRGCRCVVSTAAVAVARLKCDSSTYMSSQGSSWEAEGGGEGGKPNWQCMQYCTRIA